MFDLHIHTTYTDGMHFRDIITEAESFGIEAVGLVDHAVVTDDPTLLTHKHILAHVFDHTHQLRRHALEEYSTNTDVHLYDGIELDYHSSDRDLIAEFLQSSSFDYTIGSIHYVCGTNIQFSEAFEAHSEEELDTVVETYYTQLESLIRSELFDIAAHPDLIERNPRTAGRTTPQQADRIAVAFAESDTIPEFNAGDVDSGSAVNIHPREPLRSRLLERDVSFTYGSDTHNPGEISSRNPVLRQVAEDCDATILPPTDICG